MDLVDNVSSQWDDWDRPPWSHSIPLTMETSKEVKFSDEVTVVFHANQNPASLPATRVARTIPTALHENDDDRGDQHHQADDETHQVQHPRIDHPAAPLSQEPPPNSKASPPPPPPPSATATTTICAGPRDDENAREGNRSGDDDRRGGRGGEGAGGAASCPTGGGGPTPQDPKKGAASTQQKAAAQVAPPPLPPPPRPGPPAGRTLPNPPSPGLKDPPPTSTVASINTASSSQTPRAASAAGMGPLPPSSSAAPRKSDSQDPATSDSPESVFAPFLMDGESLDDARHRLRTALHQTKRLCHSFTDRVYSKYRVCLHPVSDAADALEQIRTDPRKYHRHLSLQMQAVRDEKDAEKREAAKLQAELAAVAAATPSFELATSAEQLLYFTAGLNLIVLPEDDLDPATAARYPDRGPFVPGSGERARGISQAAATAGEVMLDRARKAAALRADRLRHQPPSRPPQQQQLSALPPLSSSDRLTTPATGAVTGTTTAAAAPQLLSTSDGMMGAGNVDSSGTSSSAAAGRFTKPSTTVRGGNRAAPGTGRGKAAGGASSSSRATAARATQSSVAAAAAALTTGALLSVAPLADQIVVPGAPAAHGRIAAATSALLARSCVLKSTQQRLRHPYPDSMGGRRRANAPKKDDVFLQAYLALTLPPLPSTRERLERKPLAVSTQPTERAVNAVKGILQLFDGGRPTTKIRILNGMRQLSESAQSHPDRTAPVVQTKASESPSGGGSPPSHRADAPIDPVVAFSVLHAVGLVRVCESSSAGSLPEPQSQRPAFDSPFWSGKLQVLHSKIRCQRLSDRILQYGGIDSPTRTTPIIGGAAQQEQQQRIPTESIRGGGDEPESSSKDVSDEKAEPNTDGDCANHDAKPDSSSAAQDKFAGKRKYSDPSNSGQKPPSRRKNSDPGTGAAIPAVAQAPQPDAPLSQSQLLSSQLSAVSHFGGAYGHSNALNALHLANQLRSIQHPAGELADYIGTLHQRTPGFELSSLMHQASNPTSLAGLGLVQPGVGLVGFDGTRLFARDQQAAALLSSAAFPQTTSPFGHVTPYPAAVSALLGSSTLMHGQGPYSLSGSQMHSPHQSPEVQHTVAQAPSDSKPAATGALTAFDVQTAAVAAVGNSNLSQESVVSETAASRQGNAVSQAIADEKSSSRRLELQEVEEVPNPNGPRDSPRHSLPPGAPAVATPHTKARSSRPATLPMKNSDQIKNGRFDLAVAGLSEEAKLLALDFLAAAAAIVPLPKSLVSNPLKDKLSNLGLKLSPGGGALNLPRDVIASAILVWLWANHENDFQGAFDKSGRFDVDPGCNWLIHTVIETSVRAIAQDFAESVAGSQGPYFSEHLASRKSQTGTKVAAVSDIEPASPDLAKKLEWHTASLVHKALSAELQIDDILDETLPQFQDHLDFLDESRLCALRVKSQERVLLATLISRKATMSESFAHAYVSAMVRAGEALGHENLFEAVQDTDTNTSSLLPYDILTAEGDLWEEPCKPEGGFTAGLTGDDLVRRAHSRAIIQKSLFKLQERNQIRGGTQSSGPFKDSSNPGRSAGSATAGSSATSPRVGSKRKASSFGETQVPAGTGSARAKSWAVYDPNHFSFPLDWLSDHSENMPYGLHRVGERLRSLSLSLSARSGEPRSIKKAKRSSSFSGVAGVSAAAAAVAANVGEKVNLEDGFPKSTREINWTDIAGIFQSVELPKKSPLNKSADRGKAGGRSKVGGEGNSNKTIYAPYCTEIDPAAPPDDENDSESECEEDLSDAAFLARHQVVLDAMKAKHTAFLEARKRQLEERRKIKSNK